MTGPRNAETRPWQQSAAAAAAATSPLSQSVSTLSASPDLTAPGVMTSIVSERSRPLPHPQVHALPGGPDGHLRLTPSSAKIRADGPFQRLSLRLALAWTDRFHVR
ncbi:unnamed protein product [Lota lota]